MRVIKCRYQTPSLTPHRKNPTTRQHTLNERHAQDALAYRACRDSIQQHMKTNFTTKENKIMMRLKLVAMLSLASDDIVTVFPFSWKTGFNPFFDDTFFPQL